MWGWAKDRSGAQAVSWNKLPFVVDAGISGNDPDWGRVTCQSEHMCTTPRGEGSSDRRPY